MGDERHLKQTRAPLVALLYHYDIMTIMARLLIFIYIYTWDFHLYFCLIIKSKGWSRLVDGSVYAVQLF